jgi:hypothetical protein
MRWDVVIDSGVSMIRSVLVNYSPLTKTLTLRVAGAACNRIQSLRDVGRKRTEFQPQRLTRTSASSAKRLCPVTAR